MLATLTSEAPDTCTNNSLALFQAKRFKNLKSREIIGIEEMAKYYIVYRLLHELDTNNNNVDSD